MPSFLAGESSPVLFGAALPNFGVRRLLDAMCDAGARARAAARTSTGTSGRGRAVLRARVQGAGQHGPGAPGPGGVRPGVLGPVRARHGADARRDGAAVRDQVRAGDVRPGTGDGGDRVPRRRHRAGERDRAAARATRCYADVPVVFPPIPSFAPEHFAVVRCKDAGKYKQFRRGIDQLDTEGVVQVLSSDLRGDQAPVLAAVGPLQFDVVLHRLEHEFGASRSSAQLDYEIARLTDEAGVEALAGARGAEVLTRRLDGALLALFADKWRLNAIHAGQPVAAARPAARGGGTHA